MQTSRKIEKNSISAGLVCLRVGKDATPSLVKNSQKKKSEGPCRCCVTVTTNSTTHKVRRAGFIALSEKFNQLFSANRDVPRSLVVDTTPEAFQCVALFASGKPIPEEEVSYDMLISLVLLAEMYQVKSESPLHIYLVGCVEYHARVPQLVKASLSNLYQLLEATRKLQPSLLESLMLRIFEAYPFSSDIKELIQISKYKDSEQISTFSSRSKLGMIRSLPS
jgi:hypothetical protein